MAMETTHNLNKLEQVQRGEALRIISSQMVLIRLARAHIENVRERVLGVADKISRRLSWVTRRFDEGSSDRRNENGSFQTDGGIPDSRRREREIESLLKFVNITGQQINAIVRYLDVAFSYSEMLGRCIKRGDDHCEDKCPAPEFDSQEMFDRYAEEILSRRQAEASSAEAEGLVDLQDVSLESPAEAL